MAFALPYIAAGATAVSAIAQVKAGSLAKRQYEDKARREKLQASIDALNARKRGVEALRRTNASLASIIAGTPRTGVSPGIGTVADRGIFLVMKPAAEDLRNVAFNANMALAGGVMRAEDARLAGQQAQLQGFIGALSTIGNTAMSMDSLGYGSKSVAPVI
jgi:hypothetical protein